MNRDHVRFLVSGILFGFLLGYIVAYGLHEPRVKHEADPVPAAGNLGMAAPPTGGAPPGAPADAGGGGQAMMERVFQEVGALKAAIEKNPQDTDAMLRLANLYQDAGKFDDAIAYYRRILALRPDDVNPRTDMGICLRESGHVDEALAEFRKSLEIDPRHWQTWLNVGVVSLFDRNDAETAAAAFARVEELNPGYRDLPALKEAVRKAARPGK
ncbi:MAG TPA: tetratricopeptide repeat protein [Candidatus Cryosericum sp.]|nr:tetratricopeptide repeat protein [Candidatus Cryosericum sp.]